jgi:hypothetical protein
MQCNQCTLSRWPAHPGGTHFSMPFCCKTACLSAARQHAFLLQDSTALPLPLQSDQAPTAIRSGPHSRLALARQLPCLPPVHLPCTGSTPTSSQQQAKVLPCSATVCLPSHTAASNLPEHVLPRHEPSLAALAATLEAPKLHGYVRTATAPQSAPSLGIALPMQQAAAAAELAAECNAHVHCAQLRPAAAHLQLM